jgi:hypothetical protein
MTIQRTIPLVAFAGVLLAAGTSEATQGNWTITQSTTLSADHYGTITLAADYVRLDCANHNVIFNGAANNCGGSTCGIVIDGRYNAQIANCKVQGGFWSGVRLNNTVWPLVENSSATGASIGFSVQGGDHIRLSALQANGNGSGFIVNGSQQFISASGLNAFSNSGTGFTANSTSGLNLLSGNFTSNGGHGVLIANSLGAFVQDNQIAFNSFYGLVVANTSNSNFKTNSAWGNNGGGCDATQSGPSNTYVGNFFSNYCGSIPTPH